MSNRTYNIDIPGYTTTSAEDPSFKFEMRGMKYHNMSYAQMQVVQGMFLDFGERLKAIGDSLMTPEDAALHDKAIAVGRGRGK